MVWICTLSPTDPITTLPIGVDCCAAGSDELHRKELEIINMIYCHVISSTELIALMGLAK